VAPRGAAGGGQGKPGRNLLERAGGGKESLRAKTQGRLERGDRIRIETPGGGGYGAPTRRAEP
jgi:N-methylhydantoinase B/oxoprolinase/acetone carboxylase alpha subunit